MNDHPTDEPQEESFSELLDAYDGVMKDDLRVGDKVKGAIIAIGKDTVFVDTGTKVDAAVDKAELLDDNGDMPYAPGDSLELFVVAVDEHEIRLSRALSGVGGLDALRDAHHAKLPVEGQVSGTCKGGFNVQVMHHRAFCPVSQMDTAYTEKPEDHVGQTYEFLITRFEENGRNIVVSRRRLLEAKMAENRDRFYADLQVGDELEGTVTNLMPYGAFVELAPGVEGMVHVSELGWSRIEKPEEAVSKGQRIAVKVIGVEEGTDPNRKKISLSVKQIQADPWIDIDRTIQPGQTMEGKVTRLAGFGAFVEVLPGVEGLVHISEMSYVKRVVKAEDVVSPGDTVPVMVKEVDSHRRRISLSIRDAEGDPWQEAGDAFAVGRKIEGRLVKKEAFGYFIEAAPGITGLMPKSKIKAAGSTDLEKAKTGDTVAAVVIHLDMAARKLTLAPADTADEQDWRQFSGAAAPVSDLAAKLQAALDKGNKKK